MAKKEKIPKKHKHEIKKLKIEKGYKSVNWTHVILAVLISLAVTVGLLVIGAIVVFQGVSNAVTAVTTEFSDSFATVVEKNPEIALAMNDGVSEELIMMTLLKNTGFKSDIALDFEGYFTTKTERVLEKENISCVDKFQYKTVFAADTYEVNSPRYIDAIIMQESYKDSGCTIYHTSKNITFFKCPMHNCRMREVEYKISDEFIPVNLSVSRISAGTESR